MSLTIQVAKKDYTCSICKRKIPKGVRYWRSFTEMEDFKVGMKPDGKEHTNCLEFESQPIFDELHRSKEVKK
jgi:hypothetical protein